MRERPRYKVLIDGKACHGGELAWSLPTPTDDGDYTPGAWHEVAAPIKVCRSGLHLTRDPARWLRVGCEVYAAEGRGEQDTADDKTAYASARLLRPAPEVVPSWWLGVETFVHEEIPNISWLKPDGAPDPAWKVFTAGTTGAARGAARDAAWGAARDAARDAAWDAAWGAAWGAAGSAARGAAGGAATDAAWDAALYVVTEHICAGLPLAAHHRGHAQARWDVWRKGYGVVCDVDGVLYVYAVESRL